MKNHFFFGYTGDKREEVEFIYKNIIDNINDDTIIIEPFCGSCSISYYISLNKKNLKYILNDNNPYLKELYNICLDDNKIKDFENLFKEKMNEILSFEDYEQQKIKYIEIVKQNNLIGWYIGNRNYKIRPFLYFDIRKVIKEINIKKIPIYDFFINNNIEFINDDWYNIFNKYKNDSKALFIFDPPYLLTNNSFYYDFTINIYEYLNNNNIKDFKSNIYLILENNWIIKLLFKNYNSIVYNKKYTGLKKKKVEHIIINNKIYTN